MCSYKASKEEGYGEKSVYLYFDHSPPKENVASTHGLTEGQRRGEPGRNLEPTSIQSGRLPLHGPLHAPRHRFRRTPARFTDTNDVQLTSERKPRTKTTGRDESKSKIRHGEASLPIRDGVVPFS